METNRIKSRGFYFNILIISLSLLLSLCALFLLLKRNNSVSDLNVSVESSYHHVKETSIIRCGYVSNPPSCIIDPTTKKLSGIFVEVMEILAKNLNLKLEWVEEVGFGTMIEGIESNRYDIVPCAIWPNSDRAQHADFTIPLFYSGIGVYVRNDDNRFINNLQLINSSEISIATIDGEMAESIAKTDFPNAKTIQLPQLSQISNMLLNVQNKKADVSFVELYFAHEFLKNNPNTIKNIVPNNPIRIFPNTILLKAGEYKLKSMLNIALEQLINLGIIDKLIDKYEPEPGTFYRLQKPYITAHEK